MAFPSEVETGSRSERNRHPAPYEANLFDIEIWRRGLSRRNCGPLLPMSPGEPAFPQSP